MIEQISMLVMGLIAGLIIGGVVRTTLQLAFVKWGGLREVMGGYENDNILYEK